MDPRYLEAKRKWDEMVKAETASWPSDTTVIVVEYSVFGIGWEENGIYAARGKVSVETLRSIEAQLKSDEEIGEQHHMTEGEGDYLLVATYDRGDHDEYGRCVHSPYWDISVIGYRPFEEAMTGSVMEGGAP